jgi:hypothetical protein
VTSRLYDYRHAVAETIRAAMPGLKTCEELSAKFSLGELERVSFRPPAVFVVLTRTPLGRGPGGDLAGTANVAVFCIAEGPEERRERDAFVMAEGVAVLAGVKQLWGLKRVGPVEALDLEQVHATALDKKKVACIVVTFRQRVSGIGDNLFDDEGHVPTDLYVNDELVDHVDPPPAEEETDNG